MGNIVPRDKGTVPHFVGRYEVLVPIASGGMATVYLARSRGAGGFEREVALKLTHMHLRESPEFQSLLIEEAKLASSIRHQNVVSVLDVGDDPLGLFLVMDYVEGDTLSGLIRRARASGDKVPLRIATRVLLDALAGLHAAHETNDRDGKPLHIVHRDFSPQNILVGTDGVTKLTDFGIAKAASRAGNTSTGVLKGKIAYMSPEQARGAALDRRADVWAAGVLAWETVVGRPLWPRESEDVTTLIKLVTESPPRLREMDPTVSEALDEAVGKALAKDPADRWPTAAAFAKALLAAVEHADVEEVAEYVRASVGQKIEQRREQIRAMGMVRAKIGEIAEASEMTPSGDHVRAPPTSVEIAPIEESDTTEVASGPVVSASVVAQLDAPAVPATPAEESAPPAKAADSTVNIRGVRTPPRWALPVVAGVVGFGCVVLAIAALARHGHDAPAQSAQSASATAPVQPARTEVATTVATSATVAPVAVPATTTAASATTTPLRSSAPAATATAAPNPTSVVNRPVAPRATARTAPSATSKLAPSPY